MYVSIDEIVYIVNGFTLDKTYRQGSKILNTKIGEYHAELIYMFKYVDNSHCKILKQAYLHSFI